MLEAGGDLDLSHKALGAERVGQLLVQDLEGDWAIVAEIARQEDRSHAAAAELALEDVAVGEGSLEPFQGLGQRGPVGLGYL
jgi:hypothetical protein